MAQIDDAFTVPAISFDDELGIFYGEDNPAIAGFEAPIGSLYLRKANGTFFQKTGLGDNAWIENNPGVGSSTGNMDGGCALSIYLPSQIIDGENA